MEGGVQANPLEGHVSPRFIEKVARCLIRFSLPTAIELAGSIAFSLPGGMGVEWATASRSTSRQRATLVFWRRGSVNGPLGNHQSGKLPAPRRASVSRKASFGIHRHR